MDNRLTKYILLLIPAIVLAYFLDSILLGKICVGAIFVLCICMGLKERYFVNPYFLFSITPLSLLAYHNFGTAYMVDLSANTIVLGAINMLAFLFALYRTPSFSIIDNCISLNNNSSLIKTSVIFYLISLLAPLIPPLASILWIFGIPAIVCAMKTKQKKMFLFVIMMFVISAIGITSKTTMLTYCIAILICYDKYYAVSEKQKKYVKVIAVLGVVFMIFAFSFANKGRDVNDSTVDVYETQGIQWNYSDQYFLPYMYLTNGWTNLQYITETQDDRTYGLWFIRPILGYVGLKDNFNKQYYIEAYSSFNTMSFVGVAFKDFGYWLSTLMSLFLGFFVKKIYTRFIISRSPFDIACYVLVALSTLEMFFSNHFFMQSYPFTIVILMELHKKLFIRNKLVEIE